MSSEENPLETLRQYHARLAALAGQLEQLRSLPEPRLSSSVPVLGPLVVALRRFWNWLATRWYVRPVFDQQSTFNERLVLSLNEVAGMITLLLQQIAAQPWLTQEVPTPSQWRGFGFIGTPLEERLGSLDAAALQAWENAGVPALERHTAAMEARADEKQDEATTLNYPLHWRSWWECWRYLFDLALSNAILGCRPGDLVLDYAAGACWVTEFLQRLGMRTATVDLSHEMLRRGRKRLTVDPRLQPHQAAFVVGNALYLPFADRTFDGVICMNALHHMPSYRQALAEIYRVLKEGGRAVFSEPGAVHAENPTSRNRMEEDGVLEKNVSLPLIHHLARQAGFARMKVVPLMDPTNYLFEYTAGPADHDALRAMWGETLLLGPRARARFVLEKGPERPLDSCMPPPVLFNHLLRAQIVIAQSQERVPAGQDLIDRVVVRNSGDVIWRARGHGYGGEVNAGVKVCAEDGTVLRDDLGRTSLPHDMAPGEEACLEVRIPGRLDPGRYLLKYDMVVEYVAWFEQYGSLPAQRALEVTA